MEEAGTKRKKRRREEGSSKQINPLTIYIHFQHFEANTHYNIAEVKTWMTERWMILIDKLNKLQEYKDK